MRLDKFLSEMNLGTRSQVKKLIRQNMVTVNGIPAQNAEMKIDELTDRVCLRGNWLPYRRYAYYMLNKPEGVVSATRDNTSRTVISLLEGCGAKDIFPVGRLDKDSEGLLLLTNDGELAQRLTHPSGEVEKTYHVWVRGPVTGAAERLAKVRDLEGESIRPARVETLRQGEGRAALAVVIHQGKNRQVRRMCAVCGLEVERLRRVREHTLELGNLPPGKWRYLTAAEVKALQSGSR